ncbi:MAG: pseudouridine synthase [Pseudomonadota bacterium]|nr:pseudouridine synthase [Pseudomonadota bacterium]
MRLNKYISSCGVTSRRKADRMIESGYVTVNGKKVYELGTQVLPKKDNVAIQGKPIEMEDLKVYIMFYKPKYVLTTLSDPEGRPTISDYLNQKKIDLRVFPIGRLDWASEGLLILTNDGEYAQSVAHPKAEIPRTYLVKLDKEPEANHLEKLLRGVTIPGGRVKAANVEKIIYGGKEKPWYKIVITEGKNRQVRKMFEKVGFDVLKLKRVAIGDLKIGSMNPGDMTGITLKKAQSVFRRDEFTIRTNVKRGPNVGDKNLNLRH